MFKSETAADLVIGSGNLTEGGLYTNYEANFRLRLDLASREHSALLASVEAALNRWSTPRQGVCFVLDEALLKQLVSSGDVPTEAEAREAEEAFLKNKPAENKRGSSIFKALSVRAAPKVARLQS